MCYNYIEKEREQQKMEEQTNKTIYNIASSIILLIFIVIPVVFGVYLKTPETVIMNRLEYASYSIEKPSIEDLDDALEVGFESDIDPIVLTLNREHNKKYHDNFYWNSKISDYMINICDNNTLLHQDLLKFFSKPYNVIEVKMTNNGDDGQQHFCTIDNYVSVNPFEHKETFWIIRIMLLSFIICYIVIMLLHYVILELED